LVDIAVIRVKKSRNVIRLEVKRLA